MKILGSLPILLRALLSVSSAALASAAIAQVQFPNPPRAPSGPIAVPTKVPPQLLPDLTIVSAGETSKNVYYAKVKNIGVIPASPSNIYCGASVSRADGSGYSIERQVSFPGLAVNATQNYGCDFNSGSDKLKPGEKIFTMSFVVNNHRLIRESNHSNNQSRVAPGTPFAN
jgi:hypothetical protein